MARRCLVVLLLTVLVASACSTGPSGLEILQQNPMANPTLSFAEPAVQVGTEGDSDPWLGNASETRILTSFENIPGELIDTGRDELLEQAIEGGFELELRDGSGGGLRFESWSGWSSSGLHLTIFVDDDSFHISLR